VPTNYVLIDFENVQPKNLNILANHPFKVFVFIDAIVKNLVGRGHTRPRKVKTLQNTINNLISESLTEAELAALVKELQKRKLIIVNNGNIKYTLPAP